MKNYLFAVAIAASASLSTPALASSDAPSGGHFVTTPGPRGITRWVSAVPAPPEEPTVQSESRYRLVQSPGPRGGSRVVKMEASSSRSHQSAQIDCDCPMMAGAPTAAMPEHRC